MELLEFLRPKVSLQMIEKISRNDRGDDQQQNLSAIRELTGPRPKLGYPEWWPREVLELERWSDPDKEYTNRKPEGLPGHLRRLFACYLLLRGVAYIAPDRPETYWPRYHDEEFFLETSGQSVIRLVVSALAVSGATLPSLKFLLWLWERQADPALRAMAAFSILLLATSVLEFIASARNTTQMCAWVVRQERIARAELGRAVHSEKWLMGLDSYQDHGRDSGAAYWHVHAGRILQEAAEKHGGEPRARLMDLRSRLLGEVV